MGGYTSPQTQAPIALQPREVMEPIEEDARAALTWMIKEDEEREFIRQVLGLNDVA